MYPAMLVGLKTLYPGCTSGLFPWQTGTAKDERGRAGGVAGVVVVVV